MQFHLNGYRSGDPRVETAHPSVAERPDRLPAECDVLIVGAGPAGLVLAAQLAAFPEVHTVVVDRRDGPLAVGQADGVACRTVEMFAAFGLAGRLLDEAYWVNEVAFWRTDPDDPTRIARTGRVRDTEEGLSEFPHVIVNQARMLAYLREHMAQSAARLTPFYGLRATGLEIGPDDVTVALGETSVRASYVVGCDGARSAIRAAIGRELEGDATDETWGVMDVLAVTDFPDIRRKCAIYSAEGNILIIPREGGYLTRFYLELDDPADVDPHKLAALANRILHPYTLDVKDVAWWSVYEVGQRLCEKFDDVPARERIPRVFIAGDACHTHSAKAGQGMNVAMADAFNLGWKLGAVLRGTARPELLHTYSQERRAVALQLIDFDREFSELFSARRREPERFQRYFVAQGRFTAGVATRYGPSMITGGSEHQSLAEGFPVGMRFHSAPVIRLADAKPVHLGHVASADGAWRVYVFADRDGSRVRELCEHLPPEPDVRAVFQRELEVDELPPALLPRQGRFGLIDYEKAFRLDPEQDIFDLRGIDRDHGCMVVVRPDQYVAHVLPLDAHDALAECFANQNPRGRPTSGRV
jgi:phenol 2-monooxygenase (NADPH)